MSDPKQESDKVRDVWSQPPERRLTMWMEHPLVRMERLNRMVSGRPDQDCHQWFIELVRSRGMSIPIARCLTLGSGFGDLERGYAQFGFTQAHDGIDIADGAVEAATAAASGHSHIRYWREDLNSAELPESTYDVVFGHQSVHHIEKLEHLAFQVRKTLKPGGLLMLNEYIGPNFLQLTPKEVEFGTLLLQLLPRRYVRTLDGGLRRRLVVPTAEEVIAHDPSEAVRSAEIVDVLRNSLELIERRDYGGNFLQMGLHEIVGNFCTDDPRDEEWLRFLFNAEDRLLSENGVASSYAVLLFRRPAE